MDLYVRILKFPGITILCTGDIEPGERQKLTETSPNICTGAAQRELINLIGNCLYFSNNNGEFTIQLNKEKKVFAKNKLAQIYSKTKVPNTIDTTGKPEVFWDLVFDLKNEVVEKPTPSKLKKYSIDEITTKSQLDDDDVDTASNDIINDSNTKTPKQTSTGAKKAVVKKNAVVKNNIVSV